MVGIMRAQPGTGTWGCLYSAVLGFVKLWIVTLGFDGHSIISEILVSVVLTIPVSVAASYWVYAGALHWDDTCESCGARMNLHPPAVPPSIA